MKALSFVSLGLTLLMGCATGTTTSGAAGDNTAETYIRAAGLRFSSAVSSKDAGSIGAFYTDDAVMLAPNQEMSRGRDAIQAAWNQWMPMSPNLTINTDQVVQSCDLAYEYGRYEMKLTPQGAAAITDTGKFVTIWRRMADGEWRIVLDAFNTNLPAPGM